MHVFVQLAECLTGETDTGWDTETTVPGYYVNWLFRVVYPWKQRLRYGVQG